MSPLFFPTGESLRNLSLILMAAGRTGEAEAQLRRGLALAEAVAGRRARQQRQYWRAA